MYCIVTGGDNTIILCVIFDSYYSLILTENKELFLYKIKQIEDENNSELF